MARPQDLLVAHDIASEHAPEFALAVEAAAEASASERDFQNRVTRLVARFSEQVGVHLLARQEWTLATGRADAVYNRFIIEFEPPGSLRSDTAHRHTAHAIQQAKDYIIGVAKAENQSRDRLLGCAWDGRYLIFVRSEHEQWLIDDPQPWGPRAAAALLRAVVTLNSGRALTPFNLLDDFGVNSSLTKRGIKALYDALKAPPQLVHTLFEQWQLFYSEVSGYDESTAPLAERAELRDYATWIGLGRDSVEPPRLFFAVHTYFSFLAKAIARLVLEQYAGALVLRDSESSALDDDEVLWKLVSELEAGDAFRAAGLLNVIEGDFFGWYLAVWTRPVRDALRAVISQLSEYDVATLEVNPYAARDLLKKLYHYLLPRELRHRLGEYYTPDWLAERLLRQIDGNLFTPLKEMAGRDRADVHKRILDPACGSGTFLILAIRAIKERARTEGMSESDILELILSNVVGIDLNPVAVTAARVGYLLAIADLLPYSRGDIEIPVYLADSIQIPEEDAESLERRGARYLKTVVGDLPVPLSVNTLPGLRQLTQLLSDYVEMGATTHDFLERCRHDLSLDTSTGSTDSLRLKELFDTCSRLRTEGRDGIWARILKNAFMPLFVGEFDYIVGNPPWVNWEHLPTAYRNDTVDLWQRYGLFPSRGFRSILGAGRDDISILMFYVVIDRFLARGGKLGFVITQTVFKTEAGRPFRGFTLPDGDPIQVQHVDDMIVLQPFEGATNRTSVVIVNKGRPTVYPVPYSVWKKRKTVGRTKSISYDATLEEVIERTRRLSFVATPIDGEPNSPWFTGRKGAIEGIRPMLGNSSLQARKGVYASANGVFWLDVLNQSDRAVLVRNRTARAKIPIEQMEVELEEELVFPLLLGRDVGPFRAEPSAHILLTHRAGAGLRAIPQEEMRESYPYAFRYLSQFESTLRRTGLIRRYFTRSRGGRTELTGPFYSMFNLGPYTFSDWKVVWPEISSTIKAAVISQAQGKIVIPDHKLVMFAASNEDEAHYVAGVLNSSLINLISASYAVSTQLSTHLFDYVAVPGFDATHRAHLRVAEISKRLHAEPPKAQIVLEELDYAVGSLWNLKEGEVDAIRATAQELLGSDE